MRELDGVEEAQGAHHQHAHQFNQHRGNRNLEPGGAGFGQRHGGHHVHEGREGGQQVSERSL
ncbi:hypothetical protein D3C86_2118900 [compost metagenome]